MKGRESVLIVDDQRNWREVLSRLLEDEYDVQSVGSYQDAFRFVFDRETPFSVVIIDIRLNEMDIQNEEGMALARYLRELSASTSVIFLSGYGTISNMREAFRQLGAVDFLDKAGLDIADFRRTVAQL